MNCEALTLESTPDLLEAAVAQYRAVSGFSYRSQHRIYKGGHSLDIAERGYYLRQGELSFQILTFPKELVSTTQTETVKLSIRPEYILTMPRTDPPLLLRFETGPLQNDGKDAGALNAGVARLNRAMGEIANEGAAFDRALCEGLITLTRRPGSIGEAQGQTYSERIVIDPGCGFPMAIEETMPSMQLRCRTTFSEWDTCAAAIRTVIEEEHAALLAHEIQDINQADYDVQRNLNAMFAF